MEGLPYTVHLSTLQQKDELQTPSSNSNGFNALKDKVRNCSFSIWWKACTVCESHIRSKRTSFTSPCSWGKDPSAVSRALTLVTHALTKADQPHGLPLLQWVSTEDACRVIVAVFQPLQIWLHHTLKHTRDTVHIRMYIQTYVHDVIHPGPKAT